MDSHTQHHQTSSSHRRRENNLWCPGHLYDLVPPHSSSARWIRVVIKTYFFFFPQLSCPQLSQGQLICLRWFLLEHIKMFWVWDTWAVLVLPALAGPSFQDDLSQCRMWAQAHKSVLPPREVMSWCPFRMLKPLPERSSKGDLKQWPVFSDLNATLFQSLKKMKYPNTWKFLFFFFFPAVPCSAHHIHMVKWLYLVNRERTEKEEDKISKKSRFSWLSYEKKPKKKGTVPPQTATA